MSLNPQPGQRSGQISRMFFFAVSYRLDALDPNAYEAFKASRNLQDVVERVLRNQQEPGLKRTLSVQATLMTPVQPMLVSKLLQLFMHSGVLPSPAQMFH